MDSKTFLDNFGYIADAPNGVQQLRNMVLGLAIQGKLSKQKANEAPGTELLQELKNIKENLVKKKLAKDTAVSSPAPLLNEFDIPDFWVWCRVLDLCDLKTGATPSRQKSEYFGGDIKWLVSGDIHQKEIYECEGRITEKGLNASNCKILPEDSVLIALNGQGKTRATVAILRVPATCNQSLVSMSPFDKILVLPEYLFLSLQYRYYEIRDITGQKQRRGLNMKLVGELSISLPPVEEQKRIVAKVEQLMALCDQLETQQKQKAKTRVALNNAALDKLLTAQNPDEFNHHWQRIANNFHHLYDNLENLAKLRTGIVQLGVQGDLVEEIKGENCKLSSDSVTDEYYNRQIPRHWSVCEIKNVLTATQGVQIAKSEQSKTEKQGYKRYLYISDFIHDNNLKYVKDQYPKKIVTKNDLIMVNTGATSGRVFLGKEGILSNNVFSISFDSKYFNQIYLYLYLMSPIFTGGVGRRLKGGANPHMGHKTFGEQFIFIPPLEEQKRIVAKVNQLMALCDQLETKLKQAQTTSEKLVESVVHNMAVA